MPVLSGYIYKGDNWIEFYRDKQSELVPLEPWDFVPADSSGKIIGMLGDKRLYIKIALNGWHIINLETWPEDIKLFDDYFNRLTVQEKKDFYTLLELLVKHIDKNLEKIEILIF